MPNIDAIIEDKVEQMVTGFWEDPAEVASVMRDAVESLFNTDHGLHVSALLEKAWANPADNEKLITAYRMIHNSFYAAVNNEMIERKAKINLDDELYG